ncbi:hypothetical protein C8J34_1011351 [Rhizobium sp. PP-F2F-G36]|nr:hypothetical protein C8J34_1011351 [Rhizobium sp. PP-F2F-G36]
MAITKRDLLTGGGAAAGGAIGAGAVTMTLARQLALTPKALDDRVRKDELYESTFTPFGKSQTSLGALLDKAASAPIYVTQTEFGGIADCTGQGIGTDLGPALKAAWDFAIATVGDGATIVVPAGRYRVSTPILLSGNGKRNITLDMQGSVTPDAVAMRCVTIVNAFDLTVNAYIDQGGRFNPALSVPYYVNYSTTRDVVAGGGQEFFCIYGVVGCDLHLKAHGYCGRVLRTTHVSAGPGLYTGGFRGVINTTRTLPSMGGIRTAQCLFADHGDRPIGQGYWGNLDRITNDFDLHGPVWEGVYDVTVNDIDAAYHFVGPVFRGVIGVKGSTWYIGDIDVPDTPQRSYHIVFEPLAGAPSREIVVDNMTFLSINNGALFVGCQGVLTSIRHQGSMGVYGIVATITDCKDFKASLTGIDSGSCLALVSGAGTSNIELDVEAVNSTNDTSIILDASIPADGRIRLRGKFLRGYPGGQSAVYVGTFADVIIEALDGQSNNGVLLNCVPGNRVRWLSGRHKGANGYGAGSPPAYISDAVLTS